MAPIPFPEIVLIPARVLEAILYLLIAIYVKKRGRQGENSYQLNTVLFLAFLGGFIYAVLDNIVFLFAGTDFELDLYLNAVGYELAYPSLFFANIFRDIGIAGILVNIWCLFISGIGIKYGMVVAEKKIIKNKVTLAFILGISTLIVAFDIIGVSISSQGVLVYVVHADISGLIMILAVSLYFIAAILFRQTTIGAFLSDREKEAFPILYHRTKRFGAGLLVMGFGYLHSLVWGLITVMPGMLAFVSSIILLLNFITHGIWILGLMIMFSAIGPRRAKKT